MLRHQMLLLLTRVEFSVAIFAKCKDIYTSSLL